MTKLSLKNKLTIRYLGNLVHLFKLLFPDAISQVRVAEEVRMVGDQLEGHGFGAGRASDQLEVYLAGCFDGSCDI